MSLLALMTHARASLTPTRLVSAIFKDAKEHTPSVIFLGNIDLCFDEREHYSHAEGFRAEYTLLTEWSSLRSRSVGASHIIMVATSNQPWDFNESFIQIVDKTIRIPLPSTEDITKMFELYLAKLPSEDMNEDAMLFVCARLRHRNYTHQDVDLLLKGIRKIVRRDILDAKYFSKVSLTPSSPDAILMASRLHAEGRHSGRSAHTMILQARKRHPRRSAPLGER